MIGAWTHHLSDPTEKDKYERSIRNSRWILDRLSEMMSDMEKGLDRQEISPSSYDSLNWAYKQAHVNGFRNCLAKIQMLINLDLKDTDDRQPITGGRPPTTS